jgi:phospholipid transport system transporter-binding protein
MKIEATSITNENAGALLAEGATAIAAGDYAVDLTAVAEVDTAAIALLLDWQRQAQSCGGKLALSGVPADISSLAKLYGVDGLLGLDGHGHA